MFSSNLAHYFVFFGLKHTSVPVRVVVLVKRRKGKDGADWVSEEGVSYGDREWGG